MPKLWMSMAFVLLTGCTLNSNPQGMPLPNLDFSYITPYRVLNGGVEVRQDFKTDAKTEALIKSFVMAPDKIIQDYAQNRFVTDDTLPKKMVFNVKELTLRESFSNNNIVGFISGDGKDIYALNVLIVMTEIDLAGKLKKPYTISWSKKLVLAENLSLAEKDFRQFEFLEAMIGDIDRAVNDILFNRMP